MEENDKKKNTDVVEPNHDSDVIQRNRKITININNDTKRELEYYEGECYKKLKRARWYIIRCVGGKERKIYEELCQNILNYEDESFHQFFIPFKERKSKTKSGRTVRRMINELSGHIFVKMVLSDDARKLVKQTTHVVEFIGELRHDKSSMPIAITDKEITSMINKYVGKQQTDTKVEVNFNVGDYVEVTEGPFEGYKVKVQAITKDSVQVEIEMLGRVVESSIPLSSVKSI